jgi:hypothetical protein
MKKPPENAAGFNLPGSKDGFQTRTMFGDSLSALSACEVLHRLAVLINILQKNFILGYLCRVSERNHDYTWKYD